MTRDRRAPSVLRLAIPTILSSLLYSLVGLVSIKAVSGLGLPAIAAVIDAERTMIVAQATFTVVIAAATAMISQSWGAERHDEAAQYLKTILTIALVVSVVISALMIVLARRVAGIFDLDADILTQASAFIVVASCFNLPFIICQVFAAALRATGDVVTPLIILAVANVFNVVLLWVLIYGAGMIPAFGIVGAAMANGIAFCIAAVLFIGHWLTGRSGLAFRTGSFRQLALTGTVFRIGLPAAAEQLLFHSGLLAMMFIVALFGTASFAAYGVGVTLMSFSYMIGFGFAMASATIAGQHIGRGEPDLARLNSWRASGYAAVCMTAFGGMLYVLGPAIANFLGLSSPVQTVLQFFLLILLAVQPLMAIEFALGGALRGAGDNRTAMKISLAGLIGGRLAMASAAYLAGLSLHWVLAALIADYGLKAALYVLRVRGDDWTRPLFAAAPA